MTTSLYEDAVHAYVAAFGAGDAAAAAALFAAHATLEDPVGGEVLHGHAAILAFYTRAMAMGAKLVLSGPVRFAGQSAAFAFTVLVDAPGHKMEIDVIDVFRFNAEGKVAEMRAYWSQANVRRVT